MIRKITKNVKKNKMLKAKKFAAGLALGTMLFTPIAPAFGATLSEVDTSTVRAGNAVFSLNSNNFTNDKFLEAIGLGGGGVSYYKSPFNGLWYSVASITSLDVLKDASKAVPQATVDAWNVARWYKAGDAEEEITKDVIPPIITVSNVSAQNGTVTVVLNNVPAVDPGVADFVVTCKINNGDSTVVIPTNFVWNASTKTAVLTVPQIAQTTIAQNVVMSVSYGIAGTAVSADPFLVDATIQQPPELGDITVKSAVARSNTEVTVVLSNAPLRNLTASQFSIPGLAISNVTTNDNVVTLETSAQTVNNTYTLSFLPSRTTTTFKGVASVVTGAVREVDVPNLRQIRVDFTQPVLWSSASDAGNYYINLLSDSAGTLYDHSVKSITNGKWFISAGDQDVDDPDATVNYVFIEDKRGNKIIDKAPAGLGLEYDKRFRLGVRNVKGVSGYFSTSQGQEIVDDVVPPFVQSVTPTVINGTEDGDNILVVKFNEPVNSYLNLYDRFSGTSEWQHHRFEIYIDNVQVNPLSYIEHNTNWTVDAARTLYINVAQLGLAKGQNHTLKIFGATDLYDNVNVGNQNPYVTSFFYKEREIAQPAAPTKARVLDIQQIADNIIEVCFDQVVVPYIKDPLDPGLVTIKKADWTGSQWVDLVLSSSDYGNYYTSKIKPEIRKTKDGTEYSVWTVVFDANLDQNHPIDGDYGDFNYNNQAEAVRDLIVNNYIGVGAVGYRDGVTGQPAERYYAGDVYTKSQSFIHDTTAPVIDQEGAADENKLYIAFNDAPFDGLIQKGVRGLGIITVSRTDANGKTTSYDIDVDDTDGGNPHHTDKVNILDYDKPIGNKVFRAGRTVVIDVEAPLLNDKGKLFEDSVYTVKFTAQSIMDANREFEEKVTTEVLGSFNEIKESNARIVVPKAPEPIPVEGRVPQTSKGLIYSGHDIQDILWGLRVGSATGVTAIWGASEETVGSVDYMVDHANRDKIMVVFDGEVLESSALNKNNYTVNGQALSQDASIEFHIAPDVGLWTSRRNGGSIEVSSMHYRDCPTPVIGATDDEIGTNIAFVIIDLPQDTIDKDGLYQISVNNITNKSGKAMLGPVTANVALSDNTLPTAQTVKVEGTDQLVVTFDEELDIKDAAKAVNNFDVTVDGIKYPVKAIAQADQSNPNYRKIVLLTLDQNIDANGSTVADAKATVKVQNDVDGNMWIYDWNDFSDMWVNDLQNPARITEVKNF